MENLPLVINLINSVFNLLLEKPSIGDAWNFEIIYRTRLGLAHLDYAKAPVVERS